MQEGAFGLIDCLGFKGIWRNYDSSKLLKNLSQIDKAIKEITPTLQPLATLFKFPLKPRVLMLSDTVVISVPNMNIKKDDERFLVRRAFSIEVAAYITAKILQFFISETPPLTLRGCITFGDHSIRKNFIVGPAVDLAAEYQNIAEGAFIWIHPTAMEIYDNLFHSRISLLTKNVQMRQAAQSEMERQQYDLLCRWLEGNIASPIVIRNYDMPIKTGKTLECSVINPLLMFPEDEERGNVIKNYAKSFSSEKIDVLIKRQNTMKFLLLANNLCSDFFLKHLHAITEMKSAIERITKT